MADRELYQFDIEANNEQAKKAFEELKQIAEETQQVTNNVTGPQGDPGDPKQYTELTKKMTEVMTKSAELRSELEDNIQMKVDVLYDPSATDEIRKKTEQDIERLQDDLGKIRKDTKDVTGGVHRAYRKQEGETGRRTRYSTKYANYQDEPSESGRLLQQVRDRRRGITQDTNEAMRIGRGALSSRYVNHSNASRYETITQERLARSTTGADPEDIRMSRDQGVPLEQITDIDPSSERGQLMSAREQARDRQRTLLGSSRTEKESHEDRLKQIDIDEKNQYDTASSAISEFETKQAEGTISEGEEQALQSAYLSLQEAARTAEKLREEEISSYELSMDKFKTEIKETEEVIKEVGKSLEAMDEAVVKLSSQQQDIRGTDITQKGDRDSVMGRMSERAFSIGLATMAASTYAVTSRYESGKQTVDSMREDSLNVGYRTGDYDFRGIRQDYMEQGAPDGWSGQDMLGFSETVLGNLGYVSDENLTSNMQATADFSKFSGAGQATSQDYMESLYSTGAVTTADQARAIQEGFVGAVKASGMEGREKEQIDALTAINDNAFSGREISEEELRSRNVMTSVLSGTGDRAFQGENLAGFMTSADESIQSADPFSELGMLLGVGSDSQFASEDWNYEFMRIQEQGLSPENFNTIQKNLGAITGDNPEAMAAEIKRLTGTDTSVESIRDLLVANPDGIPTGVEGQALLDEQETTGEGELSTREEAYDESGDQSAQAQEAYLDKMDSLLNDNKWMDMVNEVKEAFGDFSSDGPGKALGSTLAIGGATALGTVAGSFLSSGMGLSLPKMLGKQFGGAGGGGGLMATIKSLFGGGGAGGATAGGGAAAAGGAAGKGIMGTIKGLGGKLLGIPGVAAGTKGLQNIGGKILGTGAKGSLKGVAGLGTLLDTVGGVFNVATAEEGDRLQTAGGEAAKVGGGLAGAKLGATAGTAIGGPLGTLIGGGLGYVGGKLGGSALGEGLFGETGLFGDAPTEEKDENNSLFGRIMGTDRHSREDGSKGILDFLGFGNKAEAAEEDIVNTVQASEESTLSTGEQEEINKILNMTPDEQAIVQEDFQNYYQEADPEKKQQLQSYYQTLSPEQQQTMSSLTGMNPDEENMQTVSAQEENENNNQRSNNEKLREENIALETENLRKQDAQLAEMRKLLEIAASQNGIIGNQTGGAGGGAGAGGTTGNGDYWTNTDITQHDLGMTSNQLTAEDLNEWINAKAPKDSVMYNKGETFMQAGEESGLDPRYLVSHAAHETAWGTSNIAREKGNMFGIGAFDASPYASAYGYDNSDAGIIEGAKWISENYYQDRGATTLDAMNEDYATDPQWADKIAAIMKGSENYTQPSMEVNTNVTYNGGNNENGEEVADTIASTVTNNIARVYRNETAMV